VCWLGLKIGVSMHWIACFSYTPHFGGRMPRGWRLPSFKLHLLDFFVWGLQGLEITFDSHPQPGADRSSERLVDITLHNRLTTDKCNRSHGAASELFISVWKLHYIKAFLWPSQPAQRNRNPNPLKWMAPNKLWQPCQYVNCFVVVAYAVIRTISPRIFFIFWGLWILSSVAEAQVQVNSLSFWLAFYFFVTELPWFQAL